MLFFNKLQKVLNKIKLKICRILHKQDFKNIFVFCARPPKGYNVIIQCVFYLPTLKCSSHIRSLCNIEYQFKSNYPCAAQLVLFSVRTLLKNHLIKIKYTGSQLCIYNRQLVNPSSHNFLGMVGPGQKLRQVCENKHLISS